MHDRMMFNLTSSIRDPLAFFSDDEKVVCDTEFVGDGPLICPFKSNQGLNFGFSIHVQQRSLDDNAFITSGASDTSTTVTVYCSNGGRS